MFKLSRIVMHYGYLNITEVPQQLIHNVCSVHIKQDHRKVSESIVLVLHNQYIVFTVHEALGYNMKEYLLVRVEHHLISDILINDGAQHSLIPEV